MSGDYISREAVLAEAEKVPLRERNYREYGNVVRAIPAADVVEVVHASWIEDGYYNEPCVCSNCGEPCKDTVMGKPRWNYCPSCGAKMDGYGGHPDAGQPTPYDLLYEEGGPDA